jgi:hypothetical protein
MRLTWLALALLLLPLLVPIGASQSKTSTELAATDGSGDVILGPQTPQPGFPPALPSSVATDYIDLTGLRVYDETLDGVRIAISLKSLSKSPAAFSSQSLDVFFTAQSTPPVSYTLSWNERYTVNPTATNRTFDRFPSLCFYLGTEGRACLPQRVIGWTDYSKNELIAFIPKASLQGLDPIQPEYESPVTVSMPTGTRLSNFSVESFGDFFSDRLPDSGEAGPYVLQKPSANERLRVRLFTNETAEGDDGPAYPGDPSYYYPYFAQPTDFPEVAVEPGAPFPIQMEIRNLNGAKRLVNLTVEYADKTDAAKWPVRLAPSLQIPGNETRVVNLIVNASSQVQHRDTTTVRVIARAVGFDDEIGLQTLKLVASVPPSPAKKKLFLHAVSYEPPSGGLSSCQLPGPFSSCIGAAYLNTLEEDSLATADETPITMQTGLLGGNGQGITGFTGGVAISYFTLEQPLARDVVLDINKDAVGAIKIGGSQAVDGTLTVDVHAGEVYIGGATIPFTASEMQQPIEFKFLPLANSQRLLRDSELTLETRITYSYAGPGAVYIVENPGVVPKGSFLELPIVPDPRAQNLSVAGADALISLTAQGDRDDFVNPGESRAFNVTLVNEGVDADSINITGYIESGKCGIQIKPGQRFKLDAGDSAKLGVLIRALSEAKEGDRCKARIQADSETNPGAFASLLLEVVVTNGVDLPDDTENYTADAESAQKLQREGSNGTPGAGFAASLLVTLAAFAWRRRRADGA